MSRHSAAQQGAMGSLRVRSADLTGAGGLMCREREDLIVESDVCSSEN